MYLVTRQTSNLLLENNITQEQLERSNRADTLAFLNRPLNRNLVRRASVAGTNLVHANNRIEECGFQTL